MTKRWLLLTSLGTFGASALAPAQTPEQRLLWNEPADPFRIIGNVHFVGTGELAAYLITSKNGHILIDGAMPESADQIVSNIRRLGYRIEDVEILLNSHAHMDHAGGLAQLKALSGARLFASAGDRPELESGKITYRDGTLPFPGVKVDKVIRDGDRVRVGDAVLTTVLTPGHTRGCTSWTMRLKEGRKPLDILFACSITVAGQPLAGKGLYPQAPADFERTFAKLGRLKPDIFLTFHTATFNMIEKKKRLEAGEALAFVDPTELPKRLATARTAFRAELAQQQAEAAAAP